MHRKKILTSIIVTTSLIFLSLNCFAEMGPGELAKASEARAVATSSDPLTTGLIEKKVKSCRYDCRVVFNVSVDLFLSTFFRIFRVRIQISFLQAPISGSMIKKVSCECIPLNTNSTGKT